MKVEGPRVAGRLLWWAPFVLFGCLADEPANVAGFEAEELLFSGCALVRRGPVCLFEPSAQRLEVWIGRVQPNQARWRTDRGPLQPALAIDHSGGARFVLDLPRSARWVEASFTSGAPVQRSWRLPLGALDEVPVLVRAKQSIDKGALDEAQALLEPAARNLSGRAAHRARGQLARLSLKKGAFEAAQEGLRQSANAAEQAGDLSDALSDRFVMGFGMLSAVRNMDTAQRLIEDGLRAAAGVPRYLAAFHYLRAQLLTLQGDLKGGLAENRAALAIIERVWEKALPLARIQTAATLFLIGRVQDARRTLLPLVEKAEGTPCDRADAWLMMALIQGAADERNPGPSVDPEQTRRSFGLSRAALNGCHQQREERSRNMLVEQTLYELGQTSVEKARAYFTELQALAGGRTPRLTVWEADLEGHLALAEGRPADALASFRKQRELAGVLDLAEERFRALVGQGQALSELGRSRRAVEVLREAETALEQAASSLQLGDGRHDFLRLHETSASTAVGLLVRLGSLEEAFSLARRARSRPLLNFLHRRQLGNLGPGQRARWDAAVATYNDARQALAKEAEGDWTLSAAALKRVSLRREERLRETREAFEHALALLAVPDPPTPTPLGEGELEVLYFPTPGNWLVLARTNRGLTGKSIGPLSIGDPARLAAQLFEPIAGLLDRAQRVIFLPHGLLRPVDFHALPWRGQPLAATRPVIYRADLPRHTGTAPSPEQGRALVVADPAGDLPEALAEGEAVARHLAARAPRLLTGALAGRAEVLEHLAQASFFHFAGHGLFQGTDGMDSGLSLAGGGQITVSDLLALRRVPPRVVLSACEATRNQADDGHLVGVGLAEAFLAAGAEMVIGPARPATDVSAASVAEVLYRNGVHDPAVDPRSALLSTVRELHAANPRSSSWANFRLWVP